MTQIVCKNPPPTSPKLIREFSVKIVLSVIVVGFILLCMRLIGAQSLGLGPRAPAITADQIQELQAGNESARPFVIIDARSDAETGVSVIPGAITKAEFERTQDKRAGELVIIYCTVGHRSGIYARELIKKGWDALNYEGSILDWCNKQLPVVTLTGQSTNKVHTYSARHRLADGYEAVY